jgi:hypothetical protein
MRSVVAMHVKCKPSNVLCNFLLLPALSLLVYFFTFRDIEYCSKKHLAQTYANI